MIVWVTHVKVGRNQTFYSKNRSLVSGFFLSLILCIGLRISDFSQGLMLCLQLLVSNPISNLRIMLIWPNSAMTSYCYIGQTFNFSVVALGTV